MQAENVLYRDAYAEALIMLMAWLWFASREI